MKLLFYNLKEGIFYSKLICNDGNKIIEIDARTSDAIAMAVRFNCPIYTYEFILSQAGVIMDDEAATKAETKISTSKAGKRVPVEKKQTTTSSNDYSDLSAEELNEALMRAIDEEAYEKASKIRDELNRRKSQ